MNKREWLRSQGFNVGERGRLSPAMLSALANSGIDFGTAVVEKPKTVAKPLYVDEVEFKLPEQPVMREARTLYGRTREGSTVGFVMCFDCKQHMMYCSCRGGIKAPSIVFACKEPEVRVGTTV